MTIDLPDVDDMITLINEIHDLAVKKGNLELLLEIKESEITREATLTDKYQIDGKKPSQTFIDNAYKKTGFNGELVEYRTALLDIDAELARKKALLELNRVIIDIWRTTAANERIGIG